MRVASDVAQVELRLEAGGSMDAIAADLGMTPRTIRNRLHAAGRPLAKERRRLQQLARLEDPEWLREQYVEQAHSPSSIAEALGVSTAEVVATLESFGIERPPVHPELTESALREAFADGETVSSIARAAGVDPLVLVGVVTEESVAPGRVDEVTVTVGDLLALIIREDPPPIGQRVTLYHPSIWFGEQASEHTGSCNELVESAPSSLDGGFFDDVRSDNNIETG